LHSCVFFSYNIICNVANVVVFCVLLFHVCYKLQCSFSMQFHLIMFCMTIWWCCILLFYIYCKLKCVYSMQPHLATLFAML
jgi:hypothetical protein